jgi:hypothetical protein
MVVVCDEAEQEGGSFGMAGKAGAVSGVVAQRRQGVHRLGEPPVETPDHAVGLRPIRPGRPVADPGLGADPVEGMCAAGPRGVACPGAVPEPVGDPGAVIADHQGLSFGLTVNVPNG